MPDAPQQDDRIYVGYLGLPRAQARFLRLAIPLTLLFLVGVGALIALRSEPAGDAVWDAEAREWVGQLRMEPYPVLFTRPDNEGISAWLLCEIAKFGAHERLAAFDGKYVQISGYRLHRAGRAIIELSPNDPATEADDAVIVLETLAAPPPLPDQAELGSVTLAGEIVDGKCYLGAMRPGNGLTHKACATLCIQGGLPPMLVVRNPDGSPRMILLSVDGTVALPDAVLPLIAEPVKVTGMLTRYGSLEILQTLSDGITRR